MKLRSFITIALLLAAILCLPAQSKRQSRSEYIEKYKEIATDKKNEENFSDYEFRCSDSMIQIDKKFDYYVNKLPELR